MSEILGQNLVDKSVMGSDGTEIGELHNITMDRKSGALYDLIVQPNEQVPIRSIDFDRDDQGRFRVPVGRVQAVKDYIVVRR